MTTRGRPRRTTVHQLPALP